MIWEYEYDPASPADAFRSMLLEWPQNKHRVFVLRPTEAVSNIRQYLEDSFPMLGTPMPLAEDVNLGARDQQRTGDIWMEVRYDPRHPNAYRHSANAQPLHTDGSYIPNFPNASMLACVANAGEGGETTFVSSEALVASLEAENPALLEELEIMPFIHCRSGDARTELVIDRKSYPTRVNWNYYCLSQEQSKKANSVAKRFFTYLASSPLIEKSTQSVKLTPGDAVIWKDDAVLHGRNAFKPKQVSERFLWKCAIDINRFN